MNGHAKRATESLIGLGFVYDDDASHSGKRAYRHPHEPETVLRIWGGMSEQAARLVQDKARQVVGLGTSGKRSSSSIRENARIKRQSAKAQREAEMAAAKARADAAGEKRAEVQRIIDARERRRAIESLMRPGNGR